MKKFTILLEELTTYQRQYSNEHLGADEYNPEEHHKEMFDSYNGTPIRKENRLIFKQDLVAPKVDTELKIHLKNHGWNIHDYHAGLASRTTTDMNGNSKLEVRKIGKVLQQTGGDKVSYSKPRDRLIKGSDGKPLVGSDGRYKSEKVPQTLLDFYNNDPVRDATKVEHNIVISRDLDDIAGMSSGRSWDSCMRLPNGIHEIGGINHHKIADDLEHSTLVAYSVKKGDDNIESPSGRLLIKKYHDAGNTHVIYRPDKTYGDVPSGFHEQIESLMKKHYPSDTTKLYTLEKNIYDDGRERINPLKVGLYKERNVTRNYNSKGQLHDYEDEHGIKQPAMKWDSGDYSHWKNGKLHNEDGIAKKESEFNYHYIDGERHREGNLPAIYNDKGTHEEYYYGGIRHNNGSNPTINIKDDDEHQVEYHYAGVLHSPNKDTPASVHNTPNAEITQYRKYGVYHSPDNDTPSRTKNTYRNGVKFKNIEFHKNGELHRDNDEPASIEHSTTSVTKKWYQNGENTRGNDKPHTVVTDLNGNNIAQYWDNRVGHEKPYIIKKDDFNNIHNFYRDKNYDTDLNTITSPDGDKYTVHSKYSKAIFGDKAIQIGRKFSEEPTHTIIKSGDNMHVINHAFNHTKDNIKTIDKNGVTYNVDSGDKSFVTDPRLMYEDPSYIEKLKHMADTGTKTISDKPIDTDFLDNITETMDKHNSDRIDEIYKRVHGGNN